MAGIRRAMLELGVATCCLLCDAPDTAGSKQCKACIKQHRDMRERVGQLPPESLASQWAKELLQMLARPSSYEHHETHGDWMKTYTSLLQGQAGEQKPTTQADVEAAFALARSKNKVNPIRDFANQSKWSENEPTKEELERLSSELPSDGLNYSGIRTQPSKEISQTDRSERPGEDHELVARVQANAAAQSAPEDLKEIIADLEVAEKRVERKMWKNIVDDIDDLLD